MDGKHIGRLAIFFALAILILGLYLRQLDNGRQPDYQSSCANRLLQLTVAMQTYQAANGTLPPAVVYDENGKPMHSWRALILPFIDETEAYKDYNFEEPWDSPNNLAVAERLEYDNYFCPALAKPAVLGTRRRPATRFTSYVAVTGPGTAFDGAIGKRLDEFVDGPSQTILLTEYADSDIQLLEPRDISADEFLAAFAKDQPISDIAQRTTQSEAAATSILSRHKRGFNVSMADSSRHFIPRDTDSETVRALTTIAGGEVVEGY